MNPEIIEEYLESIADSCGDEDDYVVRLWVEREMNVIRNLGIPWQDIHSVVKSWMAGESL